MDIQALVFIVLGMAGFGGLISAVVNILKSVGVVKDGQTPTWITGLNLVGVIAVFLLKVFNAPIDLQAVDQNMKLLAEALVAVSYYIVALGGSKAFHSLVRGSTFIGKSFSIKPLRA